jgi:multidrug resistance efflux pump
MRRPLPQLVDDAQVTTRGAGDAMVVTLGRPGERAKRMNASMWGAVALLEAHDDLDTWKADVRRRHPDITDDKADKILAALMSAGLVAVPGAPVPPPRPMTSPGVRVSTSGEGGDGDSADLVERSVVSKRPVFNQEITQVSRVPLRPPTVRRDLTARRTDKPGMVEVSTPEGARHVMPETEYRILLELDGIRDLHTIHAALSARGASYSFEMLSMFVGSMVRQKLVVDAALVDVAAASGLRPSTAPPEPMGDDAVRTAPNEVPPDIAGGDDEAASPSEPAGASSESSSEAPESSESSESSTPDVQGAWDGADAVASSADARKRRAERRLKQIARYAAAPAAIFVLGLIVRYPMTITYECEIEPVDNRTVRSPIDGVLAAVAVDEGQRVQAGQVLGNLDNAAVQLELVKNKAALERATAELELLKQGTRAEEVERARARISGLQNEAGLASSRLERVRGLVKQGVAARAEQDRAEADLAAISGQLQQARAELKVLQAGARPDDLKKKEAEIDSLQAQVAVSEKQLTATVLKAPMAGVITTQKPQEKVNTRVGVGDPIFEIVSPERMRATVLVSERDFDVLKKGLPMKVKVSAYPVDEFSGEVVRVAEKMERRDSGNIVRVEGVIDNVDGKLVSHMTGFAEIKGESRPIVSLLGRRVLRWVRVRFLI